MPSKVSPGPSPYIGWKWSNPHTPSKPSSSASCTRRTSSSHEMRCCATSSPNRMVRDTVTDGAPTKFHAHGAGAGRQTGGLSEPIEPDPDDTEPAPDDKDWTWVLERPCPECG